MIWRSVVIRVQHPSPGNAIRVDVEQANRLPLLQRQFAGFVLSIPNFFILQHRWRSAGTVLTCQAKAVEQHSVIGCCCSVIATIDCCSQQIVGGNDRVDVSRQSG
jgi:hypothetical protein